MLSLSPQDGGGYAGSLPTIAMMHSNQPYQLNDSENDWVGYNQNGVYVYAISESYWNFVNQIAEYVVKNEAPGQDLLVGGLGYVGVTTPPSFPLMPNVYMELSEDYQVASLSNDQILKGFANLGAQVGVYKDWSIYIEDKGKPVPADEQPAKVESDWSMYINDHLLAVAGESTVNYGAGGLGYLMADQLSNDGSLNTQTFLTNFYNNSFGPAATAVEDYYVMFNGTAADPSLSSPPATVKVDAGSGASSVNNNYSILQRLSVISIPPITRSTPLTTAATTVLSLPPSLMPIKPGSSSSRCTASSCSTNINWGLTNTMGITKKTIRPPLIAPTSIRC